MEIILVRHGETALNASGVMQGQLDEPLNEKGRRQAALVARRLASEPIKAVYASDLSRAVETAQAIADRHKLTVTLDARLREIHIGDWQGLTPQEVRERFPDEWEGFHKDVANFRRRGGGESSEDLRARVTEALEEIRQNHPEERVVIVSHGAAIGAFLAGMLCIPWSERWRISSDNACITRVRYTHRGWILKTFNDTSHLAVLEERV